MADDLNIADAPGSAQGPAVSIRNLHVAYGEREILHGVSFDVLAGETVVILGGSGSGKSTLLRTLVGLERPTSGDVIIRGKNLCALSEAEWRDLRQHIGISFQSGALFGSMSVGENVALPLLEHTALDPATIEIMVRLKLNEVGLNGYEDYMPAQLSGGMKKRAAVARAMAMDPEILFFDEPSAGLDPIIAAGIDQLLLKLKEAFGITIIVVTHELASAFLIADRMVLLDKGHIVAVGSTAELQASTHPRVRQFLDRVAEPEISQEIDYLQMLTGEVPRPRQ
jgi:phospholipid/cholesterol/gamma-HCH transport system ATP-binding protein